MPDQPDQMPRGTNQTYYEAIVQSVELWNRMPIAVLDQELIRDYAVLQAKGKYIAERKRKEQFDACEDASDFLSRLSKGS
jgi:hypothetical protein